MTRGDAVIMLDFCNDQEGQLESAIEGSKDPEYVFAMQVLLRAVKAKQSELKSKLETE